MKYSIGHVSYFVKDINKTLEFYSDVLGFRQMFELKQEGSPNSTIYVRIAPGQFIEFFIREDRPVVKHEDESFGHLCLHVEDIYAAREEIMAKGVEVTPIRMGYSKSLICFLDDPDGNNIELMQLTAESMQTIHDHD